MSSKYSLVSLLISSKFFYFFTFFNSRLISAFESQNVLIVINSEQIMTSIDIFVTFEKASHK